jgi:phosphate starvation-inducible PhoH-like protein
MILQMTAKKLKQTLDTETLNTKPSDTSPYIYQREKINFDLKIREINWTDNQRKFFEMAMDKDTRIVFINGPAGTSKTMSAMYVALNLLNQKKVSDIVLVRSAVESSDSKLGFLPGEIQEKIGVYMTPFNDKLDELLATDQINKLQKDNRLIVAPINYARGLHWAAKVVVADECQNLSYNELNTLLTRIGEFTRLFIIADPDQSDLPQNKKGGFEKMIKIFDNEESREMGIHVFNFTEEDIVRSRIVKFIIGKINKAKNT